MSRARAISGLERIWLVADRLDPPFVNQLVLEAEHPSAFELGAWRDAMERTAMVWPATRLRQRGLLHGSYWAVADRCPPVRVVQGDLWDGHGPVGADFLTDRLHPVEGPTVELLLVDGPVARVILRTHHACLDGRATLQFAHALFAARRGEDVSPVAAGPDYDAALARRAGGVAMEEPAPNRGAPTGSGSGAVGTTWHRVRLNGPTSRLLPRTLVALGRAAAKRTAEPQRVSVSVDLRRFGGSDYPAANLTGVVRLELQDILVQQNPIVAAADALRCALENDGGLGTPLAAEPMRGIPLWLMTRAGRRAAERAERESRWAISTTISNLGLQKLSTLQAPDFNPKRSFWIPPASSGLPLFLTLTGDLDGVELCGSGPLSLCGEGRLAALLEDVIRELQE